MTVPSEPLVMVRFKLFPSAPVAKTLLPFIFFFQAKGGIRDIGVTGVQTCALPIYGGGVHPDCPCPPPPPHVAGGGHAFPQSSSFPHPSEAGPHWTPACAQVLGTQGSEPQRFGPPPPPTIASSQPPQASIPPQRPGTIPQFA